MDFKGRSKKFIGVLEAAIFLPHSLNSFNLVPSNLQFFSSTFYFLEFWKILWKYFDKN